MSLDIETHDPDIERLGPGTYRNGCICGIAFAFEDGPEYYLPIRHAEDNLPLTPVLEYLRDQLKVFRGTVVGANLSYDLGYLDAAGIPPSRSASYADVLLADALIYELHESYSLNAVANRRGLAGKDELLLRDAAEWYECDPKRGMRHLPARFVGPYALQDVRLPLQILRLQEPEIAQKQMGAIWGIESRLLPALVRMRSRGVLVDPDRLSQVENWALAEETAALERIYQATHIRVPVGSVWQTKMVAPVMTHIGVKLGLTPTGKPKLDAGVLDVDHPVAEDLAWARKVNKLRTTFAQSVRDHLTSDGRIHCEFNQLAREREGEKGVRGARFGRMSCEHPNFQQQPARDEFAARWRSIYRPEPGMVWGSLDYSQQEPRMVTHYAVKAGCSGGEEAAQKYRDDPLLDNHQMMADITGLPRKQAKNIYLGLCYGMGSGKLAEELGLPTEMKFLQSRSRWVKIAGKEAQAVFDRFNTYAPYVRELSEKCQQIAQERGFIRTLLGRRCHFPKAYDGSYDWCHKALNRLIQGSSADQTKAAMVMADEAGIFLQLQLHDELGQSLTGREQAEQLAHIMRTCVTLEVPSRVDIELGPSWGEAR